MTSDEILLWLKERIQEARMRMEAASERFDRATISSDDPTEIQEALNGYVQAFSDLTEALKIRHQFLFERQIPADFTDR